MILVIDLNSPVSYIINESLTKEGKSGYIGILWKEGVRDAGGTSSKAELNQTKPKFQKGGDKG